MIFCQRHSTSLVFCCFQRLETSNSGSTPHGGGWLYNHPLLRAVLSGHLSVATTHTGHDRFIASCGAWPSQTTPPLFTELRTSRMTLRVHVGVSEFLLPVTPGQAGSTPAKSSIEFRFLTKSALFYCVFLRRLSRNKARPVKKYQVPRARLVVSVLPQSPVLEQLGASDASRKFGNNPSVNISALIGTPTRACSHN